MNEPIISPWLIYWAGRIDMVQGICLIVGFFCNYICRVCCISSRDSL